MPKPTSPECTYCGDPSTGTDYLGKKRRSPSDPNVPACNECLRLLRGNFWLTTVAERAEFLSDEYGRKYARTVNSPVWTKDELEKLDGRLQQQIIIKQAKRQRVIERIRHCNTIARKTNLTPDDVWEAHRRGRPLA